MSKGLGALVFVVGVAGLSYWGSKVQAVAMEDQITSAAEAVTAATVHPLDLTVSGRDITVSGFADTEAERDTLAAALDAVRGRRVVNLDGITILPEIAPYETALAKSADGSMAATGYAPSEAAKAELVAAGLPLDALPLGHGAPAGWAEAMAAGGAALAPLDQGSFSLTGDTLTLAGQAATPVEDEAARAALDGQGDYETVVAIDVTDPGIVDFGLDYDAMTGFSLAGILPEGLSLDKVAAALGADVTAGELGSTFAALPGAEAALTALRPVLGLVETLSFKGANAGLSAKVEALAGLDPEAVAAALGKALGPDVGLAVMPGAAAPENGTRRTLPFTGATQMAYDGGWIALPAFEVSKQQCAERAMARVAETPIQFVTGSAELDPVSLVVLNDLAGIMMLCTEGAGMTVTIGGHTDAEGDDASNYVLSAARARSVRDALAARGVPAGRMIAIGYGETEPIADNETEEGRAQNRRTTFEWPN
ncbi:MAG: OmpA family protein [Maritimibacter sp.]|nr:OmpA family protein [Maritimibacter sp.]